MEESKDGIEIERIMDFRKALLAASGFPSLVSEFVSFRAGHSSLSYVEKRRAPRAAWDGAYIWLRNATGHESGGNAHHPPMQEASARAYRVRS